MGKELLITEYDSVFAIVDLLSHLIIINTLRVKHFCLHFFFKEEAELHIEYLISSMSYNWSGDLTPRISHIKTCFYFTY